MKKPYVPVLIVHIHVKENFERRLASASGVECRTLSEAREQRTLAEKWWISRTQLALGERRKLNLELAGSIALPRPSSIQLRASVPSEPAAMPRLVESFSSSDAADNLALNDCHLVAETTGDPGKILCENEQWWAKQ